MKLIKVILRPEKKFAVKDVLADIGCHGITTKECSGFGEGKETISEIYNGRVYESRCDVSNREEMEFAVPDDKVKKVLENVIKVATTGDAADGRIYVTALEESVHIHDGSKHMGDVREKYLDLGEEVIRYKSVDLC